MMAFLKWVGFSILTVAGVFLAAGIGAVMTFIGAAIGSIAIGGCVILVIVLVVKEAVEGRKQ